MRTTSLLSTLVFIVIWTSGSAQFDIGVNAGPLLTTYQSSAPGNPDLSKVKTSFFGGVYGEYHFTDRWAVRNDIQFFRLTHEFSFFNNTSLVYRYSYLSFSPSVIYSPLEHLGVGLGLNFNKQIRTEWDIHGDWHDVYGWFTLKDHWDLGTNLSVYATWKRFTLSARYNYNFRVEESVQFTDDAGTPLTFDQRHHYLQVGVGFRLWRLGKN